MYNRMQGSGFRSSKRKGTKMARGSKRYAPRAPYNDDPRTGFKSYPLSSNRNEFFSKATGVIDVKQTTGGAGPFAASIYINYPTYYFSNASVNTQTLFFPANFDNHIALFEEYTVSSFTLSFIPYFSESVPNANSSYQPEWYSCRELTDQNLIPSEDQALNGSGTRTHSVYSKMWRKTIPQNAQWNATNNATPGFGSITSLSNPGLNTLEAIKVYFPTLTQNISYGRLICQWNVRWRGLTADST